MPSAASGTGKRRTKVENGGKIAPERPVGQVDSPIDCRRRQKQHHEGDPGEYPSQKPDYGKREVAEEAQRISKEAQSQGREEQNRRGNSAVHKAD